MLLWFAFLTIILVIAAFAFLIGSIFNGFPQAATASVLYIAVDRRDSQPIDHPRG
jgi:carbon starvation protein